MKINLLILLTFLLTLFPTHSFAKITLSAGVLYQNINDNRYRLKNEYKSLYKPNNISLGYMHQFGKFNVSVATNRLFSQEVKKKVILNHNNQMADGKFKLTYDALQVGYIKGRFMPALFIANANSKVSIMGKKEIESEILVGASLGYFITKNISTTFIYVAPNEALNMDSSAGTSINFFW